MSEAATLTLAEPVTAALLGVSLLGERLGGGGALGAALVLGGLLVLAVRVPRHAPAPVDGMICAWARRAR